MACHPPLTKEYKDFLYKLDLENSSQPRKRIYVSKVSRIEKGLKKQNISYSTLTWGYVEFWFRKRFKVSNRWEATSMEREIGGDNCSITFTYKFNQPTAKDK